MPEAGDIVIIDGVEYQHVPTEKNIGHNSCHGCDFFKGTCTCKSPARCTHATILKKFVRSVPTCLWNFHAGFIYKTACDHDYELTETPDGSRVPKETAFKYCPYCSKLIDTQDV